MSLIVYELEGRVDGSEGFEQPQRLIVRRDDDARRLGDIQILRAKTSFGQADP